MLREVCLVKDFTWNSKRHVPRKDKLNLGFVQ